jgi:type III secretion system FlhB-like substrate exporter
MAVKKNAVKTKADLMKTAKGLLKTGREKFDEMDLQPIWKKVKTGLDRAVDVVGKGTERAADKAMNLASRAGVEYQLFEYHRKLEKLLAELGGRAYDLAKRTPPALSAADAEITRMVGKITEMEKKIAVLEDEAETLKKK